MYIWKPPYFLPTDPILFAMRTAALSGVDVRLMIPYKTDTKIVEWAFTFVCHGNSQGWCEGFPV